MIQRSAHEATLILLILLLLLLLLKGSCRSGFAILLPVLLQEQPAVVLLLERVLLSWSLAMNECGGHEDLRGLDHQSVLPYIHGRMELYCSNLTLHV
jgi:hypothetical protein